MRRPRRAGKPGGGGGGGEKPTPGADDAAGAKGPGRGPMIAVGSDVEAALLGVPVAAKSEAPVQGDPVAPAADGKADAPVAKGTAEKDDEGVKWLKHYSSMHSILIVGDGDFSFSLALATAFGSGEHLVATSLDSYDALKKKYGNAESNITELKRLEATVLHGVDAKLMKHHPSLKIRRFDRIVFNFPHAGFNGKEDHPLVINLHKQLVNGFFANARHLLRPFGEIHLSHKTGYPYDAWDIEQLANESCLIKFDQDIFCKEDYPGYNQKRGDGAKCDQPFALGPCYTFKFCIGDVKKLKKARGNGVGSVTSHGGSKYYPDLLVTDMRPFAPHPLPPAWPRPHFPPANRVDVPIMFDPYPFGSPRMEHSGFPINFHGPERAPYFQHQDMFRPECRGPLLNVFPNQGGFHPPMMSPGRPEQPWFQEGPPTVPPWRADYSYSAQEFQRSLQREYKFERQLLPGEASLDYSAFLEHRFRESVQRRERLEMLIEVYGRRC